MADMAETRVDVLRHGEPVGGNRYRGHRIDDPLSEKGWQQMREGVGSCTDWDLIITSPLQRCAAFAHALGAQLGIPVTVDAGFREIGFGVWEGKTKAELKQTRAEEFRRFYADPVGCPPEGAEPVEEFHRRIVLAYNAMITRHAGKKILLVAHAGVSRAIVARALGAAVDAMYRIDIANGRIVRCSHAASGRSRLQGLNICL